MLIRIFVIAYFYISKFKKDIFSVQAAVENDFWLINFKRNDFKLLYTNDTTFNNEQNGLLYFLHYVVLSKLYHII